MLWMASKTGKRGIICGMGKINKLPKNMFAIDSIPHTWLFPKCSAVCHHGGAGTTAAGFAAGAPSIIVPFSNDQFAWVHRSYDIGVGAKPIYKRHLSVERLVEAISYALSDNVIENAKQLGKNIASENGARENGAETLKYELYKLNIKNCLGCRKCIENGGVCVLKDDFREIFENIKTADTVIISSPIYINQVNGYTKTFLDRCYPLTDKHHKPRFGKRNVIMLCTYGAPIPFIFSNYIKTTGKSLKAMGLVNKKNIIIHGCTTIDKIKNDRKLQSQLNAIGKKM